MESKLSPDKEKKENSQELKHEYQWDDLRRDRELGHYPWTHLLKPPLEGEITAEDIIRETTPRRSMSREFSRSRTHSPVDGGGQKILNLDSSPGSSRKHGEEGEDEGVHIPNFSKEVSLDSEDDAANQAMNAFICRQSESPSNSHLEAPISTPKNVSPKGILKRRVPDSYIGVTETREKTKCCHPLVNKIKHLADKTLNKLEKNEGEKSPLPKRKKHKEGQEIRQLKSSPGAVRRQKFSAIKLGDSDEMSKTMSVDTPPPRKKKEHIYEDIEESKSQDRDKSLHFSPDVEKERESNSKENESFLERKSLASQDPSLVMEDEASLKSDEHVMEKLHKIRDSNKEAVILDEEMDPDEPNVDEIFQNQLDETRPKNDSPNITITEIFDDDVLESSHEQAPVPIESSPTLSPQTKLHKKNGVEISEKEWSKTSSDHEYEIIEKPPPNIVFMPPDAETKNTLMKTDDELSSTTSLERKYLQHPSDEEEQHDDKENEGILNAELLQKDIEERYFVNTPSTMSRTECEISTSQVDSSALENLPLKRDSRQNADGIDVKIQQRIKEGAGKLKSQAGKLKTKLQSMKMPEKPKMNMPERPKFKMPERPKFTLPDRPKFTMPDKRKFSLPDRPKFKKINLSEKLSFGDKKKFTLPERPKFSVPDFAKFKMPDKTKINFPSLGRKSLSQKDRQLVQLQMRNSPPVEFETKTYPRLFNRKNKKNLPKTSSSPNLDREETPPATFTFTRMKKQPTQMASYIPDSPSEPREYGTTDSLDADVYERRQFETTYDFDKLDSQYIQDEGQLSHLNETDAGLSTEQHSPIKEEYSHVINEINNDEFFVRPRGISRENIQVREYLSDEIRQAFKIPKNALALMGSNSGVNNENMYANEPEADPELMLDDDMRYSTEDLNDRDDGYYTFPPVRPSRAKRKKKEEDIATVQYIDEHMTSDMQFSEVDLGLTDNPEHLNNNTQENVPVEMDTQHNFSPSNELRSIHEYANDDVIQYPEDIPVQSQTLPMPPQRKKKFGKRDFRHSSLNDFKDIPATDLWEESPVQNEEIIVYRTEHEYVVPQTAECTPADYIESDKHVRHESPGYATVDKSAYTPEKGIRRSLSKTPPVRRRKSHSSERKYYTVQPVSKSLPDRPPRKKSSTSLMTLDSFSKRSVSGDLTQYVEIDEPQIDEVHKDLISGEVVNKMKDRPLPPPPRPPRGPKRRKSDKNTFEDQCDDNVGAESYTHADKSMKIDDVVEIEVSTQTDPLPDDIDFELGMEENLDFSVSSSLRDIVNEEPYRSKSHSKIAESPRISRPTSRSEKSFKLSDPKISELSKSNIGRTSPTVILVERRVSSPTRINEREEMLTEASLTVQHIDIDEAHIPDVPPLPRPKSVTNISPAARKTVLSSDDQALERVTETSRDVQLDNLVTQRLQVRDLDVGRLNVSELQASKILVSDIEGMTLQVTELDSKSGHISVSGIEFSQSVIDEIVKKFAEISTSASAPQAANELTRPMSREEHTQTDQSTGDRVAAETISTLQHDHSQPSTAQASPPPPPPKSSNEEEVTAPPQRPPPPDLTPLLYSYLQDITMPPATYYHRPTSLRDRPFTEFHDAQHQSPPPPTRRAKRRPAAPHSESSSDEALTRPSPRRMPAPRPHEPTITEAGANFLRVCHNSISRTIRSIFNSFVSYISGTEDKKDVQMALVIFLVLIAGLIMFGLSDSRTIHHHHWEFFNPPDGKQ
ncbi:LOW QUALITY PROTEIN: uncharacterized protein LOC125240773 [Leguminivora glycinivorella]|uniref:LOW QUALITY PROTEIN: uncharacterized protein LOC125240773 n=1 Tax=Leguminivora glycinivorella TaxID=1035111 RepID=UPI00200EEEFA|nr:LOW QUALITY PROTEIN: uncharacterized protein LOC125240773 [Leguminivora glycinivorella]